MAEPSPLSKLQVIIGAGSLALTLIVQAFLFVNRIDAIQERQSRVLIRLDKIERHEEETEKRLDHQAQVDAEMDKETARLECEVKGGKC